MITNYEDLCCICNRKAVHVHHLVFGIANRNISDSDNLVCPVCDLCHRKIHEGESAKSGNYALDKFNRYAVMSKIIGQIEYEKKYILSEGNFPWKNMEERARKSFLCTYGKSFL